MKKESIFSNKTFLIVLSVIIAFVSWVVVSLDSNDTKGRTISGLSIDMDQVDDTISELGLSVISSDDTRVAVRVEGVTYAIGNLEARLTGTNLGGENYQYLGNLNALRDWGYAKDYVECMWLILQHDTPEDFVIATGEMHTVREFCTLAFREAGIELEWEGEGVEERGRDRKTGNILVEVDPKYFRPAEVEQLLGDPTKAKTLLGWNPTSTPFEELVRIMVRHDMKYVKTPVHF